MGTQGATVLVASLALLLGLINAAIVVQQRTGTRRAALMTDLYPILRGLRDAAGQFAKPLGGGGADHLIAVHYGLIDLADLVPAISDRRLEKACQQLLESPAAGIALSIDPPRFMMMMGDMATDFAQFADLADVAVKRCQALRRGVG